MLELIIPKLLLIIPAGNSYNFHLLFLPTHPIISKISINNTEDFSDLHCNINDVCM